MIMGGSANSSLERNEKSSVPCMVSKNLGPIIKTPGMNDNDNISQNILDLLFLRQFFSL